MMRLTRPLAATGCRAAFSKTKHLRPTLGVGRQSSPLRCHVLTTTRSFSQPTLNVPVDANQIRDVSNQVCEFDNFMFDLDGVIIQAGVLIPGVKEAIEHLQTHGKQLFFLSNNSTKSRRVYGEMLRNLGLVSHRHYYL